jgi:hypothetical protein
MLQVFPVCMAWTVAPFTASLEIIWAQIERETRNTPTVPIDPRLINLLSIVERILAYGQTGNPSVLARSAMDALWITYGIKFNSYPTFSPAVSFSTSGVTFHGNIWAHTDKTGVPPTTANRVIELSYSDSVSQVKFIFLLLKTFTCLLNL